MIIRFFDIGLSTLFLVLFTPLIVIIFIIVYLEIRANPIYSQIRVGKNFKLFKMYKLRTMYVGSDNLSLLTKASDERVTPFGSFLRKYKLDEIPQLLNVIKGDMSLVGPRPEVLYFVKKYNAEQKKVLTAKPGITDNASLVFFNESEILSTQKNVEAYYINVLMPKKLEYNKVFLNNPSLSQYFRILINTGFLLIKRVLGIL